MTDSPRIEKTTLEIVGEARQGWRFASDLIARAFRQARALSSAERRTIADRVYGLIRMDRRVDAVAAWLLRPHGRRLEELPPSDRDRLRYLVYRATVEGASIDAVGDAAGAALLSRLGIDAAALGRADQALRGKPGLELSYPDWLVERIFAELGAEDGRALLEAQNQRAPLCVRANTLRLSREELARRLAEEGIETRPLRLAPAGLELTSRSNVYGLAAFREGLLEVQDEASQLVSELVAPPPRATVVDACAGAGGKTLALGAALEGKGRIVALDVDGKKLTELRRRARRAGLCNVQAQDASAGPPTGVEAARVLLDVPCSGLGVLRRNPEARWRLTPADLAELPARQLLLCERYAPLVAPGGRLVYATCTLLGAENDAVVEAFLARHADFRLMPAKEILGAERASALGDGTFLRTLPHRHGTDGFFGAVLRRG